MRGIIERRIYQQKEKEDKERQGCGKERMTRKSGKTRRDDKQRKMYVCKESD